MPTSTLAMYRPTRFALVDDMEAISMDDVLRLANGVRLHDDRVRGRKVLLAPERVLMLDETAFAVLSRIDGVHAVSTVVHHLASAYDGDAASIRQDVIVLLSELTHRGLLVR